MAGSTGLGAVDMRSANDPCDHIREGLTHRGEGIREQPLENCKCDRLSYPSSPRSLTSAPNTTAFPHWRVVFRPPMFSFLRNTSPQLHFIRLFGLYGV